MYKFRICVCTLINYIDSKGCQKSTGLLTDRELCLCIDWGDEKVSLLLGQGESYGFIIWA